MRLHRLELRAFGPFAGTETVDFDALAEAGLFLLHGETGAGKTSVLDAVGFALYGSLPGARGTSRLLSDHAAPDAEPSVTLELTLRGRRLVVTRTPAHRRLKRRGEGFTEVGASARLEEVTPSGRVALGTRAQEVGHELGSLLPLSAEQFFQVVLLPQGEFARFLRSDSTARAALLSTLFRIERFDAVERHFADRRARSRAAVERAEARSRLVAARVAQAAGLDDDDLPEDCDGPWLQCLLEEARRGRDVLHQQSAAAAQRLAEATRSRDDARELVRRQQRRRLVEQRSAELAAQETEVEAVRSRLALADRAAPLAGVLHGVIGAREVAEADATASEAALTLLRASTARSERAHCAADPQDLRSLAGRWREEVGRLRGLDAASVAVEEDRLRLAELRQGATVAAARAAEAEAELRLLPEQRRALAAQLQEARTARVRLDALRERYAVARGLAQAAAELSPALAEADALAESERAAHEAWLDARERHDDLRERRIDGMRAELASVLEDGTPCPVCGSLSHPDLAELSPTHVDSSAEREAAQVVEERRLAREEVQARLRSVEGRVARLRGRVEEALDGEYAEPDVEALSRAAGELAARLAVESELAEREHELAEGCEALDAAGEELARRRQESAGEADRLAAVAEELETDLAARADELDRARGDDPDVAARARRLDRLAALADAAATAAEAAAGSRTRAAAAEVEAGARCRAAGFDDTAGALAALLGGEDTQALRERVDRHVRAVAEVSGLLDDAELAVPLEPDATAGAEDAERAFEAAAAAARSATAAEHAAARRADDLARLQQELTSAEQVLAPARAEAERVGALADLVSGQGGNERRMTLSSFVLAARLEEVAAAASTRLERMTSGRYTLVHSDSLAARGRRSGLGLQVRDSWTGVDRDTATLSGGETFLASLALALGLAEVVTAEAGGARLDTLFVDEGFGTLDPEALEQVLEVLDGLRDGGRSVGVVSHVAELRQRIPVGLRVSRGRAGSSLALVAGE